MGREAVQMVVDALPHLRRIESLDLVVANAENADGGSGITPAIYRKLLSAGVDGITLGDHIYKKKEIIDLLNEQVAIVKPANYPAAAPGKTWMALRSATGHAVAVISLIGRVFMKPVDCPFAAIDRVLAEIPDEIKIRIVDMHAEATSDKQLMGRYLDGRVSAVLGTHTHVPTADEQVLPGGTAYQTDVGMTGPHNSILGRVIDNVLLATLTFVPHSFTVGDGDCRVNGAIVEIENRSGRAQRISRFSLNEQQLARIRDDS